VTGQTVVDNDSNGRRPRLYIHDALALLTNLDSLPHPPCIVLSYPQKGAAGPIVYPDIVFNCFA